LVVSFFCVYFGAMYLIDGSVALARRFKVPSMLIGLFIVAWGTSTPEFFVGIVSFLKGVGELSVGNLLGSSFFDVTLVLGVVALIRPIHIKVDFLRREFPFVIVASVLLFLLASDGVLTWGDGLILLLTFGVYVYYTFVVRMLERKANPDDEGIEQRELAGLRLIGDKSFRLNVIYVVGGLFVLVLGAHWLTDSAVSIAQMLRLPQLVIGVTFISMGTVLPELVTGVMASFRGEEDIEVGNALGSLIFNLLFLFGFFALLRPIVIPVNLLWFELPALVGIGILLIPLMRRNFVLGRFEGSLLVLLYVVYMAKQFFF